MKLACDKELTHIGAGKGAEDHDHDLVYELSSWLDTYWRYDQYIANAESDPELQQSWKSAKPREIDNITQLKQVHRQPLRSRLLLSQLQNRTPFRIRLPEGPHFQPSRLMRDHAGQRLSNCFGSAPLMSAISPAEIRFPRTCRTAATHVSTPSPPMAGSSRL